MPTILTAGQNHVGGHIRDAFQEWLGEYMANDGPVSLGDLVEVDGERVFLDRLLSMLEGCGDIMPGDCCEDLDLPRGSTYAQAVTVLRETLTQ